MVSKKKKKKKKKSYFFSFLYLGKNGYGFGKKVAIFYWEWGPHSAPRDGQKIPSIPLVLQGLITSFTLLIFLALLDHHSLVELITRMVPYTFTSLKIEVVNILVRVLTVIETHAFR